MSFYTLRDEDRQFLWTLFYATGIILFWRGVWEISYELPLLKNVYFCFFVGLLILTLTGYMYKEFDPFTQKGHRITRLLREIVSLHKRGKMHEIFYFDDVGGHEHRLNPSKIIKIETDYLTYNEKGHEVFVPLHRVLRIHKGKEMIWKR